VSFLTKKKAVKNGLLISKGSSGLIKSIQEAMQSKKDLILNRSQDYFVVRYHEADIRLRLAESENQFLLHSPKIIFELMAIVLMVVLAISFQTMSVKSASYIPVLAAFALGAQRLLPSLQQIYAALSNIHARSSMLYEVVEVLSLGSESNLSIRDKIIVFDHTLRFENIYYQYPGVKINALTNVNFTLKKGDRIGIQGPSGGGKSTFINLLLGLIEPSKGAIYCDNLECASLTNTSWYAQVSHVPQDVPILDATLLENIAYGLRIEDINVDQARHAADMAKILRDVDLMDQGFMTLVGESGERLSGGQKQRIGIARALYKNAKVLILDEFTSALDNQTELEIVETIRSLPESITIVTIAHRAQALSICSRLIKIEEGNLSSMS
jgi:ATP-binding cassette subfamily B protein